MFLTLCTLMYAPSLKRSQGNAQYFVTIIDDHSRKVRVFLLISKDQVLEAFKEFHAKVECESYRKLKCVRVDNEGEYRGLFEAYCKVYVRQAREDTAKDASIAWCCRKNESDHSGEGPMYVAQHQTLEIILGRGCDNCGGSHPSLTVSSFGWWNPKGSLVKEECLLQPCESIWLPSILSYS